MKNFLIQNKEYIVVIAFIGLVSGLGYFVVWPLVNKIDIMSNQIQEQSVLHESQEKRVAELPKLREQFAFVEKEEGKIENELTKDEAVNLIQEIEKIAADTQNKITIAVNENVQKVPAKPVKSSSSKKQEEESIVEKLPSSSFIMMTVKLTGTYNGLENFMKKMENVGYYCDIISINISAQEKSSPSSSANPFSQSNSPREGNEEVASQLTLLDSSLEIAFYIKE